MKKFYSSAKKISFTLVLGASIVFSCIPNNTYAQDVEGTDFYFLMPYNNYNTSASNDVTIVSAGYAVTGSLYYRKGPGIGGIVKVPISIAAAGSQVIVLPAAAVDLANSGVVSNVGGVHIVVDTPISVYIDSYFNATVDGEAIMPTSLMTGTTFTGVSYSELEDAQLTVTATKPNTTVTFTPKYNGAAFSAPIVVTLTDSLQTYGLTVGDGAASSKKFLTGTKISSNKPIYATGRTQCSWVGDVDYPGCGACDVMISPLMPESQWGTRYITGQVLARSAMNPVTAGSGSMADYLEISAGASPANISIQRLGGTDVMSLPAYGRWFYETPKAGGIGIANTIITSSSGPFQVYQYMKGYECDGTATADAECVLIHPESRWAMEYRFGMPQTTGSPTNQITLIVNTAATATVTSSFKLNGATKAFTWNPLFTGSTYKIARYSLSPTDIPINKVLTLTASDNFALYILTAGAAESFITQGGAKFLYTLVLPVELTSFNAALHNNEVKLDWKTASEKQSDKFILERSQNAINFQPVDEIKSLGSAVGNNYTYTDKSLSPGINYYRLKLMDANGSFKYTPVQSVNFQPNRIFSFEAVRPNPTTDRVKASFICESPGMVTYRVIDMIGRTVINDTQQVTEGNNTIDISLSNLDKGIYYLSIMQNGIEEKELKSRIVKLAEN